jgi:hypothetical protein
MELLIGASRRPDRERKRSRFDIIVENVLLPIRPGRAHGKRTPKFHARFASHAPTRVSSQTMFSKSEILKLTPFVTLPKPITQSDDAGNTTNYSENVIHRLASSLPPNISLCRHYRRLSSVLADNKPQLHFPCGIYATKSSVRFTANELLDLLTNLHFLATKALP